MIQAIGIAIAGDQSGFSRLLTTADLTHRQVKMEDIWGNPEAFAQAANDTR